MLLSIPPTCFDAISWDRHVPNRWCRPGTVLCHGDQRTGGDVQRPQHIVVLTSEKVVRLGIHEQKLGCCDEWHFCVFDFDMTLNDFNIFTLYHPEVTYMLCQVCLVSFWVFCGKVDKSWQKKNLDASLVRPAGSVVFTLTIQLPSPPLRCHQCKKTVTRCP